MTLATPARLTSAEQQKRINLDLTIIGVSDWRKVLPTEIDLSHANLGKPSTEMALQVIAQANGVSFEKTLVDYLIWLGKCDLVALEVETSIHREWGKMVWIPDHPTYQEPSTEKWQEGLKASFYKAMFETEKAGIQHFCLYSTAINGMLHKSLTFHRVVLNPPVTT